MLKIIEKGLDLSLELKKKINWAKKYTYTDIELKKGRLIRLEPTNVAYVDPHKVIIKSEINRALHSVNRQMDEAAEEFYKMNEVKDEYSI